MLVGLEVFTVETVKSDTFWDVTPCSLVYRHQRFGGTDCIHIQNRKVCQASKPASIALLAASWILV
jgi:hypothetical protein